MPGAGTVIGALGVLGGLKGASAQQQAASQAAALSKEQLELYKKVVDQYLKEVEELKPYRSAMRQLGAMRMTWAPSGWGRWTSDPWRLTSDLPPIARMLNPPPPAPSQEPPPSQNPPTAQSPCPPGFYRVPDTNLCMPFPMERGEGLYGGRD